MLVEATPADPRWTRPRQLASCGREHRAGPPLLQTPPLSQLATLPNKVRLRASLVKKASNQTGSALPSLVARAAGGSQGGRYVCTPVLVKPSLLWPLMPMVGFPPDPAPLASIGTPWWGSAAEPADRQAAGDNAHTHTRGQWLGDNH